ncbi:cilia- and flagella-associated protein 97-like [Cimex lectularius]|uniref:Uncharacterized protein n=1 Tax=Cimex lectularius TaxID=79782 RepID=A0A8I6RIS2_CIMLE|nr:cilia- and flagella-associated protein 97-like [Cimex lectularius]
MSRHYEVTSAYFREINDESNAFPDIEFRCVETSFTSSSTSSYIEESSSNLTMVTPRSLSESSLVLENLELSDENDKCTSHFKPSYKLFQDLFNDLNINGKQRPQTNKSAKRANMSFTNEQARRIKRENEILLKKIMSSSKSTQCKAQNRTKHLICSAEVNRKRHQERITRENLILLRKIQEAKPFQSMKKTPKTSF